MGRGRGIVSRLALATAIFVFVAAPLVARAARPGFEHPAAHTPPDAQQQFAVDNPHRHDTPDDPDYDGAEPDDEDGVGNTNIYDEQFGLFGWPSQRSRGSATYHDGPNTGNPQISGFNASGAWKLDRGNPDSVVAILDTGIKWDRDSLRTQIHLNTGELPMPNHGRGSPVSDPESVPGGAGDCTQMADAYDANGDGAVNVLDYVCDSRVSASAGPHGSAPPDPVVLDAEDLIVAFSNGIDSEGNGFVDDIAGWDFFDNDNDPYDASSYFAAANHGSGRATNAAERGNDGDGGIGVCPHCQLMPIRIWDTFVSDGNTFAMGVLYGTDNGATVIEGANGSTYHSAFAEQASQYAYDHGVVQTYSGDDLNTGNHNYPANYSHAMLIQGTVPDTIGLGTEEGNQVAQALEGLCTLPFPLTVGCPGTSAPVRTFFRGANTTQYGGKSSISMEGTTGSENTGKAAGAAGLVISAGMDASPEVNLRPDEVREILEQTAERVTSGNTAGLGTPDPGANPNAPNIDQWTTHFGWGRVNLGAAVALAQSGKIPPEAAIYSPDWYAPVAGNSLPIHGLARARFSSGGNFHWKLEWGVGETPTGWNTANEGDSSSAVTDFGSIDLTDVRAALAGYTPPPDTGGPTFSTHSPNPYKNEFTVRLVVRDPSSDLNTITTPGVDRRVFTSDQDSTLRNGFPKRLGTGGEAPIRYADINGDNTQELIVPTEDGTIHAYEPDGSELPGWPVHTLLEKAAEGHGNAPGFADLEAATPPREPPRGALIADLDGDGRPEIIDTAGIHVYAWGPNGSPVPGFPKASDPDFCNPANESQPLVHPKCGFLSSPVAARLDGPGQPLDIVIPSLDGHLYAFDHNGNTVPGFPVQLVDPDVPPAERMIAESINEPAIGDLDGDGKDDIVAATNETYDPNPPSGDDIGGLLGQALTDLLGNAAGGSTRVYAVHSDGTNHADSPFLPGWPIKLNGAIQDTLPLIGPGQDPAIFKLGGQTRIVASATGSASIGVYKPDGSLDHAMQQGAYGPLSDATDHAGAINLFESSSIGKLDPLTGPAIVKWELSLSDVANLALAGQNAPYNHLIGAWNPQTGAPLPAFPRITDDFQFLSASNIANVNGVAANQVIAGTGLGLLHAYDGTTGLDATGFPKVTGGWLFAPAAFSNDGRMSDITREGYLFQWNMPKLPECQSEWPQFRHDPRQSGNYDTDGTPPSTPTNLKQDGGKITFTSPGDDYGCGTPDRYQIVTSDHHITPRNFSNADPLGNKPDPVKGGKKVTYDPPAHQRFVGVRAVDDAGNIGYSADLDTSAGPGPGPNNPGTVITKSKVNSKRHLAKFRFRGKKGKPPYRFECKFLHPKKHGHVKKGWR
ncbi:MAG: S8 family serine peptidase, partial [Solirubrobacterales bacterium]